MGRCHQPDPCVECERAAIWWRCTQFAGDHPYCEEHARQEKDFGTEKDGQFYWTQVDPAKKRTP